KFYQSGYSQFHCSSKQHYKNRIPFHFYKEYQTDKKNKRHTPVCLCQDNLIRILPECRRQDRDSCSRDHCHHRGTQGIQHTLECLYVPVFQVYLRQQGYDHAGRKNTACRRHGGSCQPCYFYSYKGRGINGNRSRRHLGDCDQIRKFAHTEPSVSIYDLLLDQRHCRVSPAETEKPDLKEAEKKLYI